jgi:capsule polysaccharide modification protein KpsS
MNKILYWIGQNFTHYCLAKTIQDKIEADIFAIIDVTNKPKTFFQNQKIVDFNKIWFYHDFINEIDKTPDLDFLEKFEKRHGIQLSSLVFSERLFMEYNEFYQFSAEQILRILELECKFFEGILDEIKPDFIFMFTPYFHHNVLFFKLCKAKGIRVLELSVTRFASQGVIGLDDEIKNYKNFSTNGKVRSFKELREYFDEKRVSKQNKKYLKRSHGSINDLLSSGLQYFLFSNNENTKTHYSYLGRSKNKVFFNYVLNEVKIKRRKQFIDKNFISKISDGKFILFPLQTDAEGALLLDAPLFTNQIEVIKQISKSMPIDYKLLVKEHPAAVTRSWKSIKTYKEIINTPRVIPVHPDVDISEVLKKSSLVITISSTVALDSLFYEVPSIIFSENTISMIPSIHRLKEIRNLSETISTMLKTNAEPKHLEKYIQFCEKISFPFEPLGFTQDINDYFHFSGKLIDVEITEDKMKRFLEKEKIKLDLLSNEYIKKMNNEK